MQEENVRYFETSCFYL